MKEWIHPPVETVEAIHRKVLAEHGGAEGVRDRLLLESAVAAPQATMMGKPLLSDGLEIAAAYLLYLCQNHPFVDGNKRTALATCLVFLDENEIVKIEALDVGKWEDLTLKVADGQFEREEIVKRLRELLESS